MSVRALEVADVAWAVGLLASRRARLVRHAPLLWRPADDAVRRHGDFLSHLLTDGGGHGFRTDHGLMIAAPGAAGWVVDDAVVPTGGWSDDGRGLWSAIRARVGSDPVRLVCPTPEPDRARFARERGLRLAVSWWHSAGIPGDRAGEPRIDGATASLVEAPPVYDPDGPVLFLRDIARSEVVPDVRREAARVGAVLAVVEQPSGARELGASLAGAGFVRHCDFYDT